MTPFGTALNHNSYQCDVLFELSPAVFRHELPKVSKGPSVVGLAHPNTLPRLGDGCLTYPASFLFGCGLQMQTKSRLSDKNVHGFQVNVADSVLEEQVVAFQCKGLKGGLRQY
jgi:hypothetical protein